MSEKKKLAIVSIFEKVAPQIGAALVLEPEWERVGQIVFKNGKKAYFRHNIIDLNTLGASEIARDKDYANFFMQRLGYPTIPGKAFYSDAWCKAIGSERNASAAWKYATEALDFPKSPLIIKPNSLSQGSGVRKVSTKEEFDAALADSFEKDKIALVQKWLPGKDYRIVVLDNNIISAYQRVPLSITGDGFKTISELLEQKQSLFEEQGRDTLLNPNDPRIPICLSRQNFSLESIPKNGVKIFLLDNANLSNGGEAVDATDQIHPSFQKIAVDITRDMGLRFCGVDLMLDPSSDISQDASPTNHHIIEINSAPGLDHYVTGGPAQEKIVEEMYLEVLKALEK